jgi:superfamily II DNA or RNA helicase
MVKIIIKDEVNCKIEGLDVSDRRKLHQKFKYQLPYARHLPAVRLGRWDGCTYFFQLGGSTYINLLPQILPDLESAGYDIELEDLRDYKNKYTFEPVKEDDYSHFKWPVGHPDAGQPVKIRDYQLPVINEFLNNTQCLQEVATGAGKTIMTAILSHKCEAYGRTIIIVPNKSLVVQTEVDYKLLGLDVGVYFGDRKEYNKTHTICTWQSLNNMLKNTKSGEAEVSIMDFLEGVVCVMVDEVHQAKADALKSLLTTVMSTIPIRWGLTGTIPKDDFDFIALKVSIGDVVGHLKAHELQEAGHLSNCHINIVQMIDYAEYKDYHSEIKYLTTTEKRLEYIAALINSIKDSGNTLVLVNHIATGTKLVELLEDSVFISGKLKTDDRKEHYDDYATNDNKVSVATFGVASTGINIPRIFNLVLLEPGKSFTRVIQSIGRGIRKAADKDFVQIWDLTSTCKFSKRHLTKRKQFYTEAHYPYAIEKIDWQK